MGRTVEKNEAHSISAPTLTAPLNKQQRQEAQIDIWCLVRPAMMKALALLLVCAGLGPTAAFSNMPGQAERVETRALPTDTITVKSGAFCSNRICAGADCTSPQGLYKANSPLVSHKAESLQDCAAAVKNDPNCGNGFSYGASDKYCDCPPVGEPCVVTDWPWYAVYGFKVLPRAENDCDAPPSPPPPSPPPSSPPPSCSIKMQGMGGASRDSVTVEGTVDARTVPWNEWVPVFTEAYTGCAQSAARSRVLSLSHPATPLGLAGTPSTPTRAPPSPSR